MKKSEEEKTSSMTFLEHMELDNSSKHMPFAKSLSKLKSLPERNPMQSKLIDSFVISLTRAIDLMRLQKNPSLPSQKIIGNIKDVNGMRP